MSIYDIILLLVGGYRMQKEITDEQINLVLRRAENMVNEDSIRKRLKSGKKLIITFNCSSVYCAAILSKISLYLSVTPF